MYPAGLLPPAHHRRWLAGGGLRETELGGHPHRSRRDADARAGGHRRASRRPHRARGRVARAAGPGHPVPARHRPRGERAVGSLAVRPALWRGSRNAGAAGDHPRHRRRPCAPQPRLPSDRLASERRPRRIRGAAAHPRVRGPGAVVRRGAGGSAAHDGVHDAHAGARRVTMRSTSSSWRSTLRARGDRSAPIDPSSWRSASTTTAAGPSST